MDGLKSLVEAQHVASRDKVRLIKRDVTADGVEDFVSRPPSNLLERGSPRGGASCVPMTQGHALSRSRHTTPFIIRCVTDSWHEFLWREGGKCEGTGPGHKVVQLLDPVGLINRSPGAISTVWSAVSDRIDP